MTLSLGWDLSQTFEGSDDFDVLFAAGTDNWNIVFNTERPAADGTYPFRDIRVRRAINHAVNWEAIIESRGGFERRNMGIAATNICALTEEQRAELVYEYDPEQARMLLAEAGYEDGFHVPFWATPHASPASSRADSRSRRTWRRSASRPTSRPTNMPSSARDRVRLARTASTRRRDSTTTSSTPTPTRSATSTRGSTRTARSRTRKRTRAPRSSRSSRRSARRKSTSSRWRSTTKRCSSSGSSRSTWA